MYLGRRKKITCGGAAAEMSKCPDVSIIEVVRRMRMQENTLQWQAAKEFIIGFVDYRKRKKPFKL